VLVAEGATVVPDPFAGTNFTSLSPPGGFDARGLESIAYDMEQYLKHLGPNAAIKSVKQSGLFAPDGFFGAFAPLFGITPESLDHLDVPPDLSSFFASRAQMLASFEGVMAAGGIDAFVFPQMFAPVPDLFSDESYANTTVSEINVLGTPGVIISGGYYSDHSPFALIFLGEPFSEAKLLGLAYDYEQVTSLRREPSLRRVTYRPPYRPVTGPGDLLPKLPG